MLSSHQRGLWRHHVVDMQTTTAEQETSHANIKKSYTDQAYHCDHLPSIL